MPYFRRRPTPPIEAAQYLADQPSPSGVKFKTLGNGVRVAYVTTKQGEDVTVRPGEWIVTEQGGARHYPIDNEEFQRLYQWTSED